MQHMLQIGEALLSPDILTEFFCCDLSACHGICCVEGESGAPLTPEEASAMEETYPSVKPLLSEEACRTIEKEGTAYIDEDGDLVTNIVKGKDCVFTCHEKGCCFCASEKLYRAGKAQWRKPISCALYPIREKKLTGGLVGLNYHRWKICDPARIHGRRLKLKVWQFLKEPLIERFGEEWYDELAQTVKELQKHRLL